MPVAAQVGGILWHDDVMTESGWNVAVASRADIGLESLVGLDPANLDWSEQSVPDTSRSSTGHGQPKKAQATSAAEAITAAATNR
ncbi:MAG: hypothetical protein RLZ37_1324 [Actinomycetota bacterium]|jgi:hypothetical protein